MPKQRECILYVPVQDQDNLIFRSKINKFYNYYNLMEMVPFDIKMECYTFLKRRMTKRFHTNMMNF
jgi:hypothetical protein